MKVVSSLKKICEDCYIVRRGKKLLLRCKTHPRHKRRQGKGKGMNFSTLNYTRGYQSLPLGFGNFESQIEFDEAMEEETGFISNFSLHHDNNQYQCAKPLPLMSVAKQFEVQQKFK